MEFDILLGSAPPAQTQEVLQTAAEHSIMLRFVDVLPGLAGEALRGRAPALLAKNSVIFGVRPVCRYLSQVGTRAAPGVQTAPRVRTTARVLSVMFKDATLSAFPAFAAQLAALPLDAVVSEREEADYQFNGAMLVFSKLKAQEGFAPKSPADTAKAICREIDLHRVGWLAESIQVVPNSFFVNIVLSPDHMAAMVQEFGAVEPGGRNATVSPPLVMARERVVVDFSSPNIAKEMHVGHLRSTIIGDTLARLLEYLGHEVLRVNHVGDWGTQFGMLLQFLKENEAANGGDTLAFLDTLNLSQLTALYKSSKEMFDLNEGFRERARKMVVVLQSGKDANTTAVWQRLVQVSKRGFDVVYQLLNVDFASQTIPGTGYCGESYYQGRIPAVIKELEAKKLTSKGADGAVLMFTGLQQAKIVDLRVSAEQQKEGEIPLFLSKSDGGYGYDSTDVAAARFRLVELGANRVLYVTDAGQDLHFALVFEAARLAGWTGPRARLDHVKFGVVKRKDGMKFKTRDGETVTLMSLLEDAKAGMLGILLARIRAEGGSTTQLRADTPEDLARLEALAAKIGFAAVKYADLRGHREKDYMFDRDAMLSPDGDTAVFILYAYARVRSIIDKAHGGAAALPAYSLEGASAKERAMALRLARFPEAVEQAAALLLPHVLCSYLFKLSQETSSFLTDDGERIMERGRTGVLDAERGAQRLVLVRAVRAVLFQGLDLLGIQPVEEM